MKQFRHKALDLQSRKPIVFTALSKKYFYMRMFIVKFVLEQDKIPLNPFMSFDYFLLDTASRDIIRNANNNLVRLSDELWVFGSISDGVLAEVKQAREQGKPIRFFNIKDDRDIFEVGEKDLTFEAEVKKYQDDLK